MFNASRSLSSPSLPKHFSLSESPKRLWQRPDGSSRPRTYHDHPYHSRNHHDGHYYCDISHSVLKGRSWEKKDPWPWPEPKVDARLGLQQRPLYSGSSGEAEPRLSRAGRSPAKEASNAWVAPSGPSSSQRKGAVALLWQGLVQGLESDGV